VRFLSILLFCSALFATEESPWIDRTLVPVVGFEVYGETFNALNSHGKKISYHGRTLGANGSLYLATSDLSAEVEVFTARTHKRSYSLDAFKETGRYLIFEDALGDPFAWSVGASFTQVLARGFKDPSLLYQGLFLGEIHTAQGLEICCAPEWTSRLYALEAFGVCSDSPWLRGKFGVNLSSLCGHRLACSLEGLYGFGRHKLCPSHFDGYGEVAYRTLDLNLEYSLRTDDWNLYSFGLEYRLYARNAPMQAFKIYSQISF
jgi:hypothetical protein